MSDDRQALLEATETLIGFAGDPDLEWAVNYAIHLASMIRGQAADHDLRIQCRYVLGNSQYWRGPEARRARKVLRAFCEHKRSEA